MSDNLRLINNDIEFAMPIIDADDNAVNQDSQSLYINVQRLSDNKWWENGSWVNAPEPLNYIECTEDESSGIYKYILADAYDTGENLYQIHVNSEGVVEQNFYYEHNLVPKADMLAIDSDFAQAEKLKRGLKGTIYGTVVADSGNSTTQFKTTLTQNYIDVYKNRVVTFIHDIKPLPKPKDEGESVLLTDYDPINKILKTSPMINQPAVGDEFVIT